MKVYNYSTNYQEKAKLVSCRFCRPLSDKECTICLDKREHWKSESGWTRPKGYKLNRSQLA